MLGPVIIALVIIVILPVTFFVSGGVVAAIVGWALKANGEDTHPDSELTACNY